MNIEGGGTSQRARSRARSRSRSRSRGPSQPVARFHVSGFGYTVNINLNLEAARCVYDLIRSDRGDFVTDPVMYALSERISSEFERMKIDLH